MSRDRSKPAESTVYVDIKPNIAGLIRAFETLSSTFRRLSGGRYRIDFNGNIRRTPGMKPLLHKGKKP